MAKLTPFVRPRWLDANGTAPLAGGLLYTWAAGTTTPKATYSDATGLVANTNPVVLDAAGYANVWLGEGDYKLELRTAAGVTVWGPVDYVKGMVGEDATLAVATLAALRALAAGSAAYVQVGGHTAAGDGGGGLFRWEAALGGTDNNGILIQPGSAPALGRWVRQFSGPVNARWFGVRGDGVADDVAASNNAGAYVQALAHGGTLFYPSCTGGYLLSTNPSFGSKVTVEMEDGAFFTGAGVLLTIGGRFKKGLTRAFSDNLGAVTFAVGACPELPVEWWGGSQAAADSSAATQKAVTCSAGCRIPVTLQGGVYTFTGGVTSNAFGVVIRGAGSWYTKIQFDAAGTVFDMDTSNDPINGIKQFNVIKGIGFVCSDGRTDANTAIDLTCCPSTVVRDVYIRNFRDGIVLNNSYNSKISDIEMQNIRRYGVDAQSNSNDLCFKNVVIDGQDLVGSRGYRFESCHGVSIKGGAVEDFEWGIDYQASEISYDGYIETCTEGAVLCSAGTVNLFHWLSGYVLNPGATAVFKSAVSGSTIILGQIRIETPSLNPAYVFDMQVGTAVVYYLKVSADEARFEPGGANFSIVTSGKVQSLISPDNITNPNSAVDTLTISGATTAFALLVTNLIGNHGISVKAGNNKDNTEYVFRGLDVDDSVLFAVMANGDVQRRAGLSTTLAKLGGNLAQNLTAVGNVGVGEDDLMTYAVPANALAVSNEQIFAIALGSFAANANSKRVRAYFGSDLIFDSGAAAFNAGRWKLEICIYRTGAATQRAFVNWVSSNATLAIDMETSTPARTLSGANTLKVTAEAVADNDVVQDNMRVEWKPA
jgi:hypothetical protein